MNGLRPEVLAPVYDAGLGIAAEAARFAEFTAGRTDAHLSFWRQEQCLVTTQTNAARPEFAWACEDSQGRQWPVCVRRSGGGTVFHGRDVLCVSLMERIPAAEANVDRAYRSICDLLLAAIGKLGLAGQVGPHPRAPCDGRFNVLLGGRKLAGTAARIRPGRDRTVVLAHAVLAVGGDVQGGVGAVERFERSLGLEPNYAAGCMTSLAETLTAITPEQVASIIRDGFAQHYPATRELA